MVSKGEQVSSGSEMSETHVLEDGLVDLWSTFLMYLGLRRMIMSIKQQLSLGETMA